MTGERIDHLNAAMDEVARIAEEATKEQEVQLRMRVIQFSSTAQWIFGNTDHGVEHIDWIPLVAGGTTDTAGAIDLARSVMHRKFLGEINYRPVVILVTDGQSNDPVATCNAIARLKSSFNSSKDVIIRIAIGVGNAHDPSKLTAFASVGHIESGDGLKENVPLVFNVDDINSLENFLKCVTVSSIYMNTIEDNGEYKPMVCLEFLEECDDWAWEE